MLKFQKNNGMLHTSLHGKPLLTTPQLNKGTAFTFEERRSFGLLGKLPTRVESLEEQVERAYLQFNHIEDLVQKNIYLQHLLNENMVLFYKLIALHLEEMLPILYTPIVGRVVKSFSREFRQPRGIYIPYPHRDHIRTILQNRSNPEVDLIVVTDGEGILGIGDQGIGGMDIPIAKLIVYTACGHINPLRTLPILLDVGTNNPTLLESPFYLGWRNPRITGSEYDEFIEAFVSAIEECFPQVFLHWEDFGRENARKHLAHYQHRICTFNDDMQGTGVVTQAAIEAALQSQHQHWKDQRIVIFGAGTAGTGIADQLLEAMEFAGLDTPRARKQFWLIDKNGLLFQDLPTLTTAQQPFARETKERPEWGEANFISLEDVISHIKPTILIGCSGVPGAFTPSLIQQMSQQVARPIILPLSNPPECMEATPDVIVEYSQGRALIATGSPFDNVQWSHQSYPISQCNNAYVFPGIGLGVIASRATRLTNHMLMAACNALVQLAPIMQDPTHGALLPPITQTPSISIEIARALAKAAQEEGVAERCDEHTLESRLQNECWEPRYLPMRYDPHL